MTKATAYFLRTLREYLATQPTQKRRELQKLHVEMTDGKKLDNTSLSRHLALNVTPLMDTALVYLRFAQRNGLITAGSADDGLFLYVDKLISSGGAATGVGKQSRAESPKKHRK